MPTRVDLTMYEGNDETVLMTLTPTGDDDLNTVTGLELVLKPSVCDPDTDGLVLTSGGGGITITSQTSEVITAEAVVPRTVLTETYERAWRVDALTVTSRRTVLYGAVTVIDL